MRGVRLELRRWLRHEAFRADERVEHREQRHQLRQLQTGGFGRGRVGKAHELLEGRARVGGGEGAEGGRGLSQLLLGAVGDQRCVDHCAQPSERARLFGRRRQRLHLAVDAPHKRLVRQRPSRLHA